MIVEPAALPSEISVRRSDPVYMAHGYLTKVPVDAIIPFIEAFTEPGEVVLDPFAGSGMTGVAAMMAGRRAVLSDISRLGQHIGLNYVNLVDQGSLREVTATVLEEAALRVRELYTTPCSRCGRAAELVKATWSQDYACNECGKVFTYYQALEANQWHSRLSCSACGSSLQRRNLTRTGESMVLEAVRCGCAHSQIEQPPSGVIPPRFPELEHWPDVAIDADREMYRRSALAKHDLTSTARFFSRRNLTALVALRDAIHRVGDPSLRGKLLFAFTAILPRASKRYQWSRQRPLNAQNQTYYVSSVFYEWNVFDLFERKVGAAIASDNTVRGGGPLFVPQTDVDYKLASADNLSHVQSETIDYVFTDPPFGSNIFYSDMNLFQEAWLDGLTDRASEAVIVTSADGGESAHRYEALLTGALIECRRVLKPGGWLSMVFSNSRGQVWGIAQRALKRSGLEILPDRLSSIDKGQRSVKGLASGWEDTVTTDLVFTARKPSTAQAELPLVDPARESIAASLAAVLSASDDGRTLLTPSRVYLAVIRRYIQRHWDLEPLHYEEVVSALRSLGYSIDSATGWLISR